MEEGVEPKKQYMHYNGICDSYNKRNKFSNKHSQNKEEKLKTVDVASYCKKFEKLGLLSI